MLPPRSDFDATALAKAAKAAGMKYVVYTTVHCDGFAQWPSNVTSYNAGLSSGRALNLYGDLVAAVRKEGLKVGAYLCTTQWGPDDADYVWPDPMTTLNSLGGEAPTYDPQDHPARWDAYVAKLHGMVAELADTYAPDIFWFDCHNAPPDDTRLDRLVPAIRAATPGVESRSRVSCFEWCASNSGDPLFFEGLRRREMSPPRGPPERSPQGSPKRTTG